MTFHCRESNSASTMIQSVTYDWLMPALGPRTAVLLMTWLQFLQWINICQKGSNSSGWGAEPLQKKTGCSREACSTGKKEKKKFSSSVGKREVCDRSYRWSPNTVSIHLSLAETWTFWEQKDRSYLAQTKNCTVDPMKAKFTPQRHDQLSSCWILVITILLLSTFQKIYIIHMPLNQDGRTSFFHWSLEHKLNPEHQQNGWIGNSWITLHTSVLNITLFTVTW
jgi:hypothetical protein